MVRLILAVACLLPFMPARTQPNGYPYDIERYDFIRYDLNRFVFGPDSSLYMHFMEKYGRLIRQGDEQISVVHIGGSHLQADIYSDRIRSRFQTLEKGDNGGRGFIFPYRVAGTNNPSNFRIDCTGQWESCRNVEKRETCILGLSGISVTTADTNASITVTFPEDNAIEYDFNRVRVFFLDDSLSFDCYVRTAAGILREEEHPGSRIWYLDDYTDSLVICLAGKDSSRRRFTLLGISLETDDPGMIYHAIGVNGAKVGSFLRCSLLPGHLSALAPDLVVLSIGTNDAYTRYFNARSYRQDYDSLICRIREAVPTAAILITVPNDTYLNRRYVNRNTEKLKEVIMELAGRHNCGVWDFYSIMGGLNSIVVWERSGLAARDRVHFTREGYILMGDLFFNAFLKSYDNYVDQGKRN